MRTVGRIGGIAAGLATGLAAAAVVAYAILLALGLRPAVVLSGSMEPTLPVGSVAWVESVPSTQVRVGDVITFADPYDRGRLITHRVVQVVERPGRPAAYRTKGDANPRLDPWTIELPAQAGRLSFSVPYLGYGLSLTSTREARTALIGLVSLLVLVSLLRRIWRQQPEERAA